MNAHFTEFAGWKMPLYYSSIIKEHMAVRTSVGIFDISHLGKLFIKGQGATALMQCLIASDIEKVAVGCGTYAIYCNENGGVLDDEIVYRLGPDEYLAVPNAARTEFIKTWAAGHAPETVTITNRTPELCLLALQGPESDTILKNVFHENPASYKRYAVRHVVVNGYEYTVMKSGYTGENGYEIIAAPKGARYAWDALLGSGVTPCGLGARDTLRLEMGYMLYGHELTPAITPLEARLERLVAFDKGDFIGREALLEQKREGIDKRLIGFVMDEGIARDGSTILDKVNFDEIGWVTSGGYSPVLQAGIGLGYIKSEFYQIGLAIYLRVRDKLLQGHLAERPFIYTPKTRITQEKAS